MKKRNNGKRNVQFIAAAALTAALMAGQIQPAAVYGGDKSIQVSSLIPDNVTVEQPVPLSEIALPSSDYGTLAWADSSSVPSERVQSYDVVFRPYDSADLSKISGWDGKSDAIYGSVTVVVNSMEEQETEEPTEEENSQEEDNQDQKEEMIPEEEESQGGETAPDKNGTQEEENVPEENTEEEDAGEQKEETEQPEASVTPEVTKTPETSITPEVTETPEVSVTPEATETPEASVTPEVTEAPEASVTPEVTEAPEASVTPEVTEAPEASVTPEVTETPEISITPEADKDNIFDRKEENKDTRPDESDKELSSEEQAAAAEANHSCNGISVSGINLPWYVQFRATTGEEYQFSNEDEANLFKSYEFELWDLKNNKEYEIPDGEYISVTVPVKAGYTYTIEHLLDNGAMETIVPSVEGSTMVFSTHSFSPFGIAGSKPLVGEEIQEDGYNGSSTSSSVTVTPAATTVPSGDSTGDAVLTPAGNNTDSKDVGSQSGSTQNAEDPDSADEEQSDSTAAVNTGDSTPIAAFVILAVAAVVIVGVILYLRLRKK